VHSEMSCENSKFVRLLYNKISLSRSRRHEIRLYSASYVPESGGAHKV
jgi:hypothetical protein